MINTVLLSLRTFLSLDSWGGEEALTRGEGSFISTFD